MSWLSFRILRFWNRIRFETTKKRVIYLPESVHADFSEKRAALGVLSKDSFFTIEVFFKDEAKRAFIDGYVFVSEEALHDTSCEAHEDDKVDDIVGKRGSWAFIGEPGFGDGVCGGEHVGFHARGQFGFRREGTRGVDLAHGSDAREAGGWISRGTEGRLEENGTTGGDSGGGGYVLGGGEDMDGRGTAGEGSRKGIEGSVHRGVVGRRESATRVANQKS